MNGTRLLALTALLAAPPPATGVATAQGDAAVADFLARARHGTEPFRDPAAARAAGYRPIGPETPAMAQHWLQPSLLVEGQLDAAKPQVLLYATVAGRRVLVGVAYAIPLGPGQAPPAGPLAAHLWHTHQGPVNTESSSSGHAGSGAADGDRVAVLHAWIWVENPAGPFTAENWALPYVRAALAPPHSIVEPAARALALASGAGSFYQATLRTDLPRDSTAVGTMAHRLAAVTDSVVRWRRQRVGSDSLSVSEVEWLAGLWGHLEVARRDTNVEP